MKGKVVVSVIFLGAILIGTIYFYNYCYVRTLMLSEIGGKTDNAIVNLTVNFLDFDTGITRHDIKQLKDKKEYWITRINQLDEIQDVDQKQEETLQFISDFFEEPAVKKLKLNLTDLAANSNLELIKTIFNN
jgi:hypothetical protein